MASSATALSAGGWHLTVGRLEKVMQESLNRTVEITSVESDGILLVMSVLLSIGQSDEYVRTVNIEMAQESPPLTGSCVISANPSRDLLKILACTPNIPHRPQYDTVKLSDYATSINENQ